MHASPEANRDAPIATRQRGVQRALESWYIKLDPGLTWWCRGKLEKQVVRTHAAILTLASCGSRSKHLGGVGESSVKECSAQALIPILKTTHMGYA
jgi:hypothetical protein